MDVIRTFELHTQKTEIKFIFEIYLMENLIIECEHMSVEPG